MTNSQSGDTNDGSTDDDEFVVVNPGGEHMSLSQKSIQKLKAWLNPTDSETPASEYRKHLNSHAKGTGEWILETDQYREWSQSNSVGNLWIRGIPGCGKSVVAAGLISRLRRAENGLVLFFFFREIIQANRTPRSLMQDFCHGMLDHSPWLQSELDQLQTQHSSVESVPYDKLWKCMATAMQSIGKVHCVVDALDEMEQGNDQFFKELLDLGRRSPASIKLIVTSRQVPHVEKHLNGISLVDLRLDRRNVDRDIAIYSAQRLEDTHLDLSLEKLEQVKQAICERGRGLFLYARLMLDQLLLQPQLMLANIENLPDGLGDMYTELLHDHAIRSGTSAIFQQIILQWITHSARPLRLLELFVMIDSLPDRAGLTQEQDAKLAIRTTCGPLLEVCEDGVVQIIHHSLTEFVLNRDVVHTQMSNQVREISGFHSPTIHGMITRVCINYLSNGCLDQWPTDPHTAAWKKDGKELMLRFYFLRYAVLEWPFHAANADESDDELLHLLDQFCQDGNQSYEAWKKIWPALQPNTIPSNCSPLDIAAYCGIFAFAKHLIGKRANTDSRNSKTNGLFPPLLHAIKKNHHRIVSLLLQHGANREKHDGRDPVFYATELNHVESLRALIEGGVDPKTTAGTADGSSEIIYCEFLDQEVSYSGWNKKRTPLACACHDGYIEAVQELIKHLDSAYLCKGYLHIAAEQGKSTVVKTLLQDEKVRLSINDKDSDGNTPLYLAAKSRDYATIQVLLDHGADISISSMNLNHPPEPPHTLAKYDRDGVWPNYSALHGLAFGARRVRWKKAPERSNWIKALKMLLSAGCDINARDHRGRTPLFWWSEFPAASDKYEATEFVATLLEYGANASLFDYEMSSPLHRSSTKLTPRMVELLVNGGVDLNSTRDSDGMTPLMFMASSLKNHEVSSWRDMKANFAQKDWAGNTAFHHCFCSLARALKENDTACWMNDWFAAADLGAQNHCGRTPFLEFLFRQPSIKFMDRDHIKVVQEFVKNGALLEGRDFSGRTALLTALDHPILRSLGIVEEILRLGGDVKATDNEGKSGE
ncbi:uncharacterized protein N7479_009716 [Penicillium vulpinum]|nr:uncharacterized protein N7479_009716 [Penicillium vulpinum]KAJ5951303.1 hypothetical protein N7479_009716 [Penicillium vulpinum]